MASREQRKCKISREKETNEPISLLANKRTITNNILKGKQD